MEIGLCSSVKEIMLRKQLLWRSPSQRLHSFSQRLSRTIPSFHTTTGRSAIPRSQVEVSSKNSSSSFLAGGSWVSTPPSPPRRSSYSGLKTPNEPELGACFGLGGLKSKLHNLKKAPAVNTYASPHSGATSKASKTHSNLST